MTQDPSYGFCSEERETGRLIFAFYVSAFLPLPVFVTALPFLLLSSDLPIDFLIAPSARFILTRTEAEGCPRSLHFGCSISVMYLNVVSDSDVTYVSDKEMWTQQFCVKALAHAAARLTCIRKSPTLYHGQTLGLSSFISQNYRSYRRDMPTFCYVCRSIFWFSYRYHRWT